MGRAGVSFQPRMNSGNTSGERPIIIGFGPAGMFAALELIENGIRPRIFERGKKIEERDVDVQAFIRNRILNPESNIQFGEGGAGSYSDGKLFSRVNNSKYANKVLETFVKFGAPEEILHIRKPHLGTDVLCRIVRNMRDSILAQGGEIHYSSRMTDIVASDGLISGVIINGNQEYHSTAIYLAVGNSSRDTFELLHARGVLLEQKPISVGVRIEHPVGVINCIRSPEIQGGLSCRGAATYSFNSTNRQSGRGVYTFCMCPGGEIVNASSENGHLVLNGMSYSARASAFSNSALVVNCRTDDYRSSHPLAGIRFQQEIERKAFEAAGSGWGAPAQNLTDFIEGRPSYKLIMNSFKMGVVPCILGDILPAFVSEELLRALAIWKADYPLFVSDQAILIAAETRTSSPVRIRRDERYESVNLKNLYPIGEGSGYTGGITSAAIDAIKAVERSLV